MTKDPNLRVQIDGIWSTINIRQSAISSWLDCPRKFYWEYLRGLEPDYPTGSRPWTNADIGSALHAGMEGYYLGADPIDAARDWIIEQDFAENKHGKAFDHDLVRIMLEGHVDDLATRGDDLGETTIAVEEPIISTVADVRGWDITIHGKIDRRIETNDGLTIIDDLKSVDRFMPVDNYLPQLMRYALLVRNETGWRADRVRTTQVRRVKRTGDGPFYQRPWAPVNDEMYRTAAVNLRGVLTRIVQDIESDGPWYEHRTGECDWKCRVEDLCKAQVRGDDPETIVDIHFREKGSITT